MADKVKKLRLTETVRGSGWACKIGPEDLAKALKDLPLTTHPNLIVGMERTEDAGVYQLADGLTIPYTTAGKYIE